MVMTTTVHAKRVASAVEGSAQTKAILPDPPANAAHTCTMYVAL